MGNKPLVIIKNDMTATFKFMSFLGEDISHKFDLVVAEALKDLTARGHNDMTALLTNETPAVFWTEDPGKYAEHEMYFFLIYIKGPDGQPKIEKFLIIDKTDREVYKNSENIVSRLRVLS